MKNVILIFILCSTLGIYGQEVLLKKEGELRLLLDDLRNAKNDTERKEKNAVFKQEMAKVLIEKDAISHPFSSLKTIGVIDSPDKMLRIINWNVEQEDFTQRYFGFILHYDKRRKKHYIIELKEDVFGVRQPEEPLTAEQWYGGLYYKIIPITKGRRTVYTLLGWDGLDAMSTMKFVDALTVNGKMAKFGYPIFKISGKTKLRLFYEYSDNTTMVLNYEPNRNRIMMDHLSPESPSLKGHRAFYVPDLSYDALILDKGKWVLKEDVIGVNKAEEKKRTLKVYDEKSKKNVEIQIKNEWKDPSSSSPLGDFKHQAALPEEPTDTKKEKSKHPKTNKKDKRKLGEMYQSSSKRKRKK